MADAPEIQTPVTDSPLAFSLGFGELTEKEIEEIRSQLIYSDGEPMETYWHVAQLYLLIDATTSRFHDRDDFFVGGNMFVYYSSDQLRRNTFRGPDYFFVWGVERYRDRKYWWVVDEEGKLPDVIIELISPTTAKHDRNVKKDLYEQIFKTTEYFCIDPTTKRLEGWRLTEGAYQPIETNDNGWMWSEQLEMWLGPWRGYYRIFGETDWFRFYDENGKLVLMETEAAQQLAKRKTEDLKKSKKILKQSSEKLKQSSEKLKQTELELKREQSQRLDLERQLEEMKKMLSQKGLAPPEE